MFRTKAVSKKLFIEELEQPAAAWQTLTSLAIGEEADTEPAYNGVGEEQLANALVRVKEFAKG